MAEKNDRLSSTFHKKEKERLEKILKNQNEDSEEQVTYEKIDKVLVPDVTFERLLVNGEKTVYVKCLHKRCSSKSFVNKDRIHMGKIGFGFKKMGF